ncbi:hypothetical protein MW290_32170 (plasmid) [Aquincola tertiaricarbonis]|uniref:Uncharacterized protein n=1 Tax=Aquincola tertiaricarbonis TaxID=391953 RepID=A0ABY4SIJ9_AQUTE|nr:hypothetical protein [Aquincola tertiaricarbonis]URI11985.1 hypothetical protein MW290_32170 [Aquincola tertiaricarbonis]
MTRTEEVESIVRLQFPLLFGEKELVTNTEFELAFNAIAEQGIKWAEPALKPETHKHQWTLVGTSIALYALVLFNVRKVQIGTASISVDRQVIIWYSVFAFALLLTFLLRASLDLKRAALAREKDSEKLEGLNNLVQAAWIRRNIEYHFFLELNSKIQGIYGVYDEARGLAIESKDYNINALNLDIEGLKKIPDYSKEIAAHEEFLAKMIKKVEKDCERFKNQLLEYESKISTRANATSNPEYDRWTKGRELFDSHLKPWFDAQNRLLNEHIAVLEGASMTREGIMLDAQKSVLTRARRIQHAYAFTEIALPSVLACGSVIYATSTVLK